MATVVNKKELAKVLGVSLPTLDRLIDRYEDFPVERKGGNGKDYSFAVDEVKAFVAEQRGIEEKREAARADLLSDLDILLPGCEESDRILTPNQKLSLVRAERERHKLQRESPFLVEIASVRKALVPVCDGLGQFVAEVPYQMGKRFNLPVKIVEAMAEELSDEWRRVVGMLNDNMPSEVARSGQ